MSCLIFFNWALQGFRASAEALINMPTPSAYRVHNLKNEDLFDP
jgi:hypothetical protein